MLSLVVYSALALIVAAIVVAVLVVVLPDDTVSPALRDVVPAGLPAGADIGADDVNRLRLPVGVRGYRMSDTDAVLDRLSAELERRDHEIAALRLARAESGSDGMARPGLATTTEPIEADVGSQGGVDIGSAGRIQLGEPPEHAETHTATVPALLPGLHRRPQDDAPTQEVEH